MQIQLCICVSYRPPKSRYKLSVHSKHSAWQVLHVLHLARILEFLRIIIYLQNLWKEWIKLQNTDLLLHLRPAPAALCPTHPWPVEAQVWAPPLWEAILPLLMFLKLHIGSLDIRWDNKKQFYYRKKFCKFFFAIWCCQMLWRVHGNRNISHKYYNYLVVMIFFNE